VPQTAVAPSSVAPQPAAAVRESSKSKEPQFCRFFQLGQCTKVCFTGPDQHVERRREFFLFERFAHAFIQMFQCQRFRFNISHAMGWFPRPKRSEPFSETKLPDWLLLLTAVFPDTRAGKQVPIPPQESTTSFLIRIVQVFRQRQLQERREARDPSEISVADRNFEYILTAILSKIGVPFHMIRRHSRKWPQRRKILRKVKWPSRTYPAQRALALPTEPREQFHHVQHHQSHLMRLNLLHHRQKWTQPAVRSCGVLYLIQARQTNQQCQIESSLPHQQHHGPLTLHRDPNHQQKCLPRNQNSASEIPTRLGALHRLTCYT
jgi:hypothetical protein